MAIDWLEVAKEYGPATLSVVGSVLAFLISTLWAAAIWAYGRHRKQMTTLQKAVLRVVETQTSDREATAGEHGKIKEVFLGYRAEIHLLKLEISPLKAGMLNLEGAVKNQNDTINKYVEKMGVVSGKLDAVFSVFEAKARATDILKQREQS